jgi:hypothetical protein
MAIKVKVGPQHFIAVLSYKQASEIIRERIDKAGMGSAEWYALRAGGIFVDGIEVAHVSYNGRVWEGKGPGKAGDEEIPL